MDTPTADAEPVVLDAAIIKLAQNLDTGIAVLPLELSDGQGIYSESSVMLVKELRALGAEAAFAHPPEQRLFEARKSAGALLVTFVIGIASTASWDLMKLLLRRRGEGRMAVTFVELQDGHGRRSTSWKVEGDSEAVIQAIDSLREEPLPREQSDDDGSGE